MIELVAERFSEIVPQSVRWLWKSFLPRGKLCLLDGDPGVGKSLIAMDLAARLSRGGTLPDGQKLDRPLITVFLALEDNSADTMRPRAEAAGANLDCIVALSGKDGAELQLPRDHANLHRYVAYHNADLLVIDPIVAFLPPSVAVSSDQCVRQALARLARIASGCDCTILMVRHLRKAGSAKPVYQGAGTIGFIAAARTGLTVSRNAADPALGVLAVTKSNLAEPPPALGYHIATNASGLAVVEWTGPVKVDPKELRAAPMPALRSRDRASFWLQDQLSNGPRRASELYALAAVAGISERTLRRAMGELDVQARVVESPEGKWERLWMFDDGEIEFMTGGTPHDKMGPSPGESGGSQNVTDSREGKTRSS